MMCVCRYLAQVASPRSTIPDSSDKRRRVIFELLMCVGLPIIGMALRRSLISYLSGFGVDGLGVDYVVQGHRFDIFEDFGPIPVCKFTSYAAVRIPMILAFQAIYVSVAALFLVYLPPLVLSLGTLVYAGM
jgi:pheromone a factor receptor